MPSRANTARRRNAWVCPHLSLLPVSLTIMTIFHVGLQHRDIFNTNHHIGTYDRSICCGSACRMGTHTTCEVNHPRWIAGVHGNLWWAQILSTIPELYNHELTLSSIAVLFLATIFTIFGDSEAFVMPFFWYVAVIILCPGRIVNFSQGGHSRYFR